MLKLKDRHKAAMLVSCAARELHLKCAAWYEEHSGLDWYAFAKEAGLTWEESEAVDLESGLACEGTGQLENNCHDCEYLVVHNTVDLTSLIKLLQFSEEETDDAKDE